MKKGKAMKRYDILRNEIPAGGRTLTRAEVNDLRAEGLKLSERWRVMPYAPDINYGGHLYYPYGGGLNSAGIQVRTI